MGKKEKVTLRHKIIDYTRFSFVLLFTGTFMMIGTLIPYEGKSSEDRLGLTVAAFVFIAFACYFCKQTIYFKRKLEREQ